MIEHKVTEARYGDSPKIELHDTEQLSKKATIALDMAVRWGMVAGTEDGEDSSGRAKGVLTPVQDVVGRACETTEKLFAAFYARGWVETLPTFAEMDAELVERQLIKDENREYKHADH